MAISSVSMNQDGSKENNQTAHKINERGDSSSKVDLQKQEENETKSYSKVNKFANKISKTKSPKIRKLVQKQKSVSKRKTKAKWKFLEHNGPVFPPAYKPLPTGVHFKYNGKIVKLRPETEEVMTFYAKILSDSCAKKKKFISNFFGDWRKVMSMRERSIIKDFQLCDFTEVHQYFKMLQEQENALSVFEKRNIKKKQDAIQSKYGFCIWNNQREMVNNFKVEPPGLFKGRGNHPKMGRLKKRISPEEVTINCSVDATVPEPPSGHKWKQVCHKDSVSWLASWTENISNTSKYIWLNPASKFKGQKDFEKYQIARKLKSHISLIRKDYTKDFTSNSVNQRQRAVVLYFIDKLALRVGNEKGDGETTDTVGCCSLRCEHVKLYRTFNGQNYVVMLDFLGKDSIPYHNRISVPAQVFSNLKLFKLHKRGTDKLFDLLMAIDVNKYLNSFMEGLTAKVFRTYNASTTLQSNLKKFSKNTKNITSKLFAYNRANREVALLCNHQRSPAKNFDKQIKKVKVKLKKKMEKIAALKRGMHRVKGEARKRKNIVKSTDKIVMKKKLARLQDELARLKLKASNKVANKKITLETSKLNYLDPRITVAWCLRNRVPIEKVYSKTQRDKFKWAIDAADRSFVF